MFERFGIKDIFIGLWKYRFLILIITLSLTILGVTGLWLLYGDGSSLHTDMRYSYSKTCYFEDKSLVEATTGEALKGFTKNELAVMYHEILNKNFARENVMQQMLQKYTKEQIIDIYQKTKDIKLENPEEFGASEFGTLFKTVLLSNNVGLEYYVISSDEEFTQDMMSCYDNYMKASIEKLGGQINIIFIDELKESWDENQGDMNRDFVKRPYIRLVLVFVIALIATCFGVFIALIIKPTMNRASDFENTGVAVLGEWKR